MTEIEQESVLWRDKKRWMFFGLPWTFTSYEVTEKRLRISTGFFKKTEDDVLLYRISDVTFFQTLGERINKLGTLCVMSSDTSTPEVHLVHIKNARKVKELLHLNLSVCIDRTPRNPTIMCMQNPNNAIIWSASALHFYTSHKIVFI